MSRVLRSFAAVLALLGVVALGACASWPETPALPEVAQPVLAKAKAGDAEAMEAIGQLYHYGDAGTPRNLAVAFSWYLRAAERGLGSAQDYVGMFHAGGLGGAKADCGDAIRWFERAVASGWGHSRNNLAWMLATCDDARWRDGARALSLVQALIAQDGPGPDSLSTLAAAFAEIKDYERAAAAMAESLRAMEADAGASPQAVRNARQRLEAYRAGKPWRGIAFAEPEVYSEPTK
jgi:TPR repeat protein